MKIEQRSYFPVAFRMSEERFNVACVLTPWGIVMVHVWPDVARYLMVMGGKQYQMRRKPATRRGTLVVARRFARECAKLAKGGEG